MPQPLYLLFGLYGLLLLATPFLAIALYFRNSKLRKQLNELAEENTKQHTKLQRAIGELQSKLGATASYRTPSVEKPATTEASQPSVVPVPPSYPHVPIPSPIAVPPQFVPQPPLKTLTAPPIPPTEKTTEAAPEQKPQASPPSVPLPPVTATPPAIPPVTPAEPKPIEPKPLVPTPQPPAPESQPTTPQSRTRPRCLRRSPRQSLLLPVRAFPRRLHSRLYALPRLSRR
jgi:hypothetical protein